LLMGWNTVVKTVFGFSLKTQFKPEQQSDFIDSYSNQLS
jgi:hypothetical protein